MPTTLEALLIVALVLSPGYIFTQLARRVIPHVPEPTDIRFLLTIVTAGTILHGVPFPWTSRILDFYLAGTLRKHLLEVYLWVGVVIVLVPGLAGIGVGRLVLWSRVEQLLDHLGLGYIDRVPTAWDYVMRQRQPGYVTIHLKDGKGVVGGVFANVSFASLDARHPDIYLEEAWQIDEAGNFDHALAGSLGLWVAHDVMAYAHFFAGSDKPYEPETSARNAEAIHPETGHGEARRSTSR